MMKGRNFVFVVVVAVLTMFVLTSYVWAGAPCKANETIKAEPVLQAVVVMDSAKKWVSVRISPNLDSKVNSQAWMFQWNNVYPKNAESPLNYRISEFSIKTFDGKSFDGQPIITNVENFKTESTGIVSFDARIQFVK